MNIPPHSPRIHVLVGCDRREHIFASNAATSLAEYYSQFKQYSEEHHSETDCRNFIGWLHVCTDLQLLDTRDTEVEEYSDRFHVPCLD